MTTAHRSSTATCKGLPSRELHPLETINSRNGRVTKHQRSCICVETSNEKEERVPWRIDSALGKKFPACSKKEGFHIQAKFQPHPTLELACGPG